MNIKGLKIYKENNPKFIIYYNNTLKKLKRVFDFNNIKNKDIYLDFIKKVIANKKILLF